MDFDTLQCFIATAEEKSFSKAADRLYLSQPAISRKISQLEKEVDTPLFVRTTRSIQLTPAGEVVLKWARILLKDQETMMAELNQTKASSTTLKLGFYWLPHLRHLSHAIQEIHSQRPRLDFQLSKLQPHLLRQQLLEDSLDGILIHLPDVAELHNIQWKSVEPCGLCVIVPKKHPLASKSSFRLRELSGENYVSYVREVSPFAYDAIVKSCLQAGFTQNIVAVAKDLEEIGALVVAGMGIALMSSATGAMMVKENPLCMIPISDFPNGFDLVFAWKKDNPNTLLPQLCELIH